METTKFNKILAVAMTLVGVIGTVITKDATGLAFALMIAIPLFFCKKNVTMFREDNNNDTNVI